MEIEIGSIANMFWYIISIFAINMQILVLLSLTEPFCHKSAALVWSKSTTNKELFATTNNHPSERLVLYEIPSE